MKEGNAFLQPPPLDEGHGPKELQQRHGSEKSEKLPPFSSSGSCHDALIADIFCKPPTSANPELVAYENARPQLDNKSRKTDDVRINVVYIHSSKEHLVDTVEVKVGGEWKTTYPDPADHPSQPPKKHKT